MADLILTSNTTYEAVDLINGALSGLTNLWSASTGDNSLIALNDSGNLASENSAYAEGYATTSSGFASHSEGYMTVSSGNYSHTEGCKNTALGIASFAGGSGSTADGNQSFVFGKNNSSTINNSAVMGGYENVVSGSSGSNSTIFAGYKNKINLTGNVTDTSTIVGGIEGCIAGNNQMTGIFGGFRNAISSTTSDNSVIIGGEYNVMNGDEIKSCAILGGYFGSTEGNNISNSFDTSIITSRNSSINFDNNGAGEGNQIISSYNSSIDDSLAGFAHNVNYCSILGGLNNNIRPALQFTSGNLIKNIVIIGGENNESGKGVGTLGNGNNSVTLAGSGNTNWGKNCVIAGGEGNIIGTGNNISAVENCVIFGSYNINVNHLYDDCIQMGNSSVPRSAHTITMGYNAAPTAGNPVNNRIAFNMQQGYGIFEGAINAGPADYAEFFEWNDSNLLDEDRVGYAVSLIGDKIEKGNNSIIGITSAAPGFTCDSASLAWDKLFLRDEFGRKIEEEYDLYLINSGQTEIYIDNKNNTFKEPPNPENMVGELYEENIDDKVFKKKVRQYKINHDFDKNQNYTTRADRKEWIEVGLLGKLDIRTSEQITGNKISIDSSGMAINGTDYYILEKTKDYDGDYGIVQILFK